MSLPLHYFKNLLFFTAALLLGTLFPFQSSTAQQMADDTTSDASDDLVIQYVQKANELWGNQQTDLQLATDLLYEVSSNYAQRYYGFATTFYNLSLRNADFENEREEIQDELERLKPLVPDSTGKRWDRELENENRKLLNEIIGFWEVRDPYTSTQTNERLIEHWQRIHYAKNNYTKVKRPPYNTDDRGIYYVRLGEPQRVTQKTIQINQVVDPNGTQTFSFEMGNIIRSEIEIWEYPQLGENHFLLFGERNGWGEFGLRRDVLELFEIDRIRVEISGGGFMPEHEVKEFSKTVAQLGILEELSAYHPFFDDMYTRLRRSLMDNSYGVPIMQKYVTNSFKVNPLFTHQYSVNRSNTPPNKTTAVPDDAEMATQMKIFRFLSAENTDQFVIATRSLPEDEHTNYTRPLHLNNQITVYDEDWNQLTKKEDTRIVDGESVSTPSVYLLEEPVNQYDTYFSSELIDTTLTNVYIPDKINPQASAIISTSGRKQIQYPDPLNQEESLLISDIVLGFDQSPDYEARIPLSPAMDYVFEPDTDLMVFFEAYNIPQEGYTFEYYFERHRRVLQNKRPDEKPSVTIINEEVGNRHTQTFSISLSDLQEGTYDLVLDFRPLNADEDEPPVETRKIELEIAG